MRFPFVILLFFSALSFSQRTDVVPTAIGIDFSTADSIANNLEGHGLKRLPSLVYRLTTNLNTDVEKFRAIYTWICKNIENDYTAYLRTVKKRRKLSKDKEAFMIWNNDNAPKAIEKLIKDRKTACTGYAYLVREMAALADIKCEIVDGYGRTATLHLNSKSIPNHSWNSVLLDGKWYLCDATWSAGQVFFEDEHPVFKKEYHDGYFLANPELFVKNHYPLETKWTLLNDPPTFDDFIDGPVVYKEAFTNDIIPVIPQKMEIETVKNESVKLKLKVPQTVSNESFSLVLNSGYSNKNVSPKITQDPGHILLEYSYNKFGSHDLHIKYEDEIIATYVVKVKRK